MASLVASPEPEEHSDGDMLEPLIRRLEGPRCDLLRTTTYYCTCNLGTLVLGGRQQQLGASAVQPADEERNHITFGVRFGARDWPRDWPRD